MASRARLTIRGYQRSDMIDEISQLLDRRFDAVCFDAFGTLVEIRKHRRPFVPLFRSLPQIKRRELKYRLMREDRDPSTWPDALGVEKDPLILDQMLEAIDFEVQSVKPRTEMAAVWRQIADAGMKIAICSNLASSYGPAVRRHFSPHVDVFSYEVNAIKPEPKIYQAVLRRLEIEADRVLFVGDTNRTDIEGPAKFGFSTLHVEKLVSRYIKHDPLLTLDRLP